MKNIVIYLGSGAQETKFNVLKSFECEGGIHHFTCDTSLGLNKVTVVDSDSNLIRRYNTQSMTPE